MKKDENASIKINPKTFSFEVTWGKLVVSAFFGMVYFSSPVARIVWGYSDTHNDTLYASKAMVDKEFSALWKICHELDLKCTSNSQKLDDISRAAKP